MTKSPHFWWLICLLGLTIIILIAFIITKRIIDSEKLLDYIAVCSTLLSITLSIFAIQYTYNSNNEIHQQFEKINSAAEIIKATSKSLSDTNALFNNNLSQILESLENVGQSQQSIAQQLENLTNQGVSTDVNNTLSNLSTQQW